VLQKESVLLMLLSAPPTFQFILSEEHKEQRKNNKNIRTQRLVKPKREERRFPLDALDLSFLSCFLL